MPAVSVAAEKILSKKNDSGISVLQLRNRFLIWLNLWFSSLIGELLAVSARR